MSSSKIGCTCNSVTTITYYESRCNCKLNSLCCKIKTMPKFVGVI